MTTQVNTPAVSVVMSVYNAGIYLRKAVGSVLSQTYQDLELVVINDGSTDGSGDVLDEFAASDRRVRVLHQENRGLIASLNRGVAEARGPLIARMDADDVSLPHRLERQIAYLDAHPEVGIVGGIVRYVNDRGEAVGGLWPEWSPPVLNGWRTLFETMLCHPTVVLRREVLDSTGLYDASALHAEDYELWTRALFETLIANVPDVVLERRIWEGTVGAQHAERQEQTVIESMHAAHERVLGRPVPIDVVSETRRLARGQRRSARPDLLPAVAKHLLALYDGYTRHIGQRSPEVEAHVSDLLLTLARAGTRPSAQVLWQAIRNVPRGTARVVARRVRGKVPHPSAS